MYSTGPLCPSLLSFQAHQPASFHAILFYTVFSAWSFHPFPDHCTCLHLPGDQPLIPLLSCSSISSKWPFMTPVSSFVTIFCCSFCSCVDTYCSSSRPVPRTVISYEQVSFSAGHMICAQTTLVNNGASIRPQGS
jgi:hypothetical protein